MTANSFGSRAALEVAGTQYEIYRLDAAKGSGNLPYSLKILLENLLRNEDGANITADHVRALADWDPGKEPDTEIQFTPARVILQDLTGVPAVVDLAAMREAMQALGGDATKINPLIPAELVIDHSVVADVFGRPDAFTRNVEIEFHRNGSGSASCAGARMRSASSRWSRPAPASSTRSTSSTWPGS
jgi:aconitate hydratase